MAGIGRPSSGRSTSSARGGWNRQRRPESACRPATRSGREEIMEKITVAQARRVEAVGREVRIQGWVRTRRDSKGGFSFLEVNDGSSLGNLQVLADRSLPNYESEVLRLGVGSSITLTGVVRAPP